jgi:hypothetical protein
MAKKSKVDPRSRPEYDRTVFEVLHALAGISNADLARETYISATTFANWRKGPKFGGTRWPQHHNLVEAARVAGLVFELRDKRTGRQLDVSEVKEPTVPPKGWKEKRNAHLGTGRRRVDDGRGTRRKNGNGVGRVRGSTSVQA